MLRVNKYLRSIRCCCGPKLLQLSCNSFEHILKCAEHKKKEICPRNSRIRFHILPGIPKMVKFINFSNLKSFRFRQVFFPQRLDSNGGDDRRTTGENRLGRNSEITKIGRPGYFRRTDAMPTGKVTWLA